MHLVNFVFEDIPSIKLEKRKISNYVNRIIENENFKMGNISIVMCSDKFILDINRKFLDHDFYTDIITFNYNEKKVISGDLLISIDRIRENAIKYNEKIDVELYRVIFHGILHLLGYDDKDKESEMIIREKENLYLKTLLDE